MTSSWATSACAGALAADEAAGCHTLTQYVFGQPLHLRAARARTRPKLLTMMMMMMTFITQRGESQGKTKKERKATKSKGRGLEEGG